MCESLVVVVLMRPDVVLYHIARINFSLLIETRDKSILKRRMICERNQTLTCEYTTRRHLPKTNLVFNFKDASPLTNRFNRSSGNRLNRLKKPG